MTGLPDCTKEEWDRAMARRNQCDGCRAGYPRLVSLRFGRKSFYHVMGKPHKWVLFGQEFTWTDTMSCERDKYNG